MKRSLQIPPLGFADLAVDEKIEYVQALWNLIAADADVVPVHSWQRDLLNERLEEHRAAPDEKQPWKEAVDDVEARFSSRRPSPTSWITS